MICDLAFPLGKTNNDTPIYVGRLVIMRRRRGNKTNEKTWKPV